MGFRSGKLDAIAVSPVMLRRVALVIGVVFAFLAITAVASADSGKSKAKFSASADILLVGPADLLGIAGLTGSTEIDVKTKKHDPTAIKSIVVNTVNEAVLTNFPGPGGTTITGCKDSDAGGACGAVGTLIAGSNILSLHTSSVKLSKVQTFSVPAGSLPSEFVLFWVAPLGFGGLGILPELTASLDTYSGKLKGKLTGAFTVTGLAGPLVGDARLKIKGTATYGCFTDNPVPDPAVPFLPLPSLLFCSSDNPLPPIVRTLFLPSALNVVDKGSFTIEPEPGVVVGADHELVKMKGKLKVTVDAAFGVLANTSVVEITKADAKFVMPGFEHDHE
jgi:hypothetical protein